MVATQTKAVAAANGESATGPAVKRAVLIWLTLQNSVHTLLVRYSRARDVEHMFLSSVAVFWTETVKLAICLVAVMLEAGSFVGGLTQIYQSVVLQPFDTAKVAVLAFIYTAQNNLFYLAASHLNAATFMVTSQLKIFTTAIFAVIMLRKQLLSWQWLALLLLFTGVSVVQLEQSNASSSAKPNESDRVESPMIGFGAVVAASTLSGFAGIYFEKILKGATPVSLWMRNVQLAVCAIPIALLTAYTKDTVIIKTYGLLYGFDGVVWLTVFWYGIGGLSVAVVIKYADNIAKNFATSVAIIISTVASMFIFDFVPTLKFVTGGSMVIGSIFLYSMPPAPPKAPSPAKNADVVQLLNPTRIK